MNLYNNTTVYNYRHYYFFQKMILENKEARYLYLQHFFPGYIITDTKIINEEEYSIFKDGAEFLATIEMEYQKESEIKYPFKNVIETLDENDNVLFVNCITANEIVDIYQEEGDDNKLLVNFYTKPDCFAYNNAIQSRITDILNILDNAYVEPEIIVDDFYQLDYLIRNDKPIKGIKPSKVVKQVIALHESFIHGTEIQWAKKYDQRIIKAPIFLKKDQKIYHYCKMNLIDSIKTIISKLGYEEDTEWLSKCKLYQLERILDFDYKYQKPTYHQIKEILQI